MNGTNGHEMRDAAVLKVLNRLLILFQYSLASYLRYADPWTQPGKMRLPEVVGQLTADHQAYVVRIGQMILKRRGKIERGQFSMRFTAYNDLALDYLAQRLVEHERELIDEIGGCVAALDHDPEARQLVENILARESQRFQTLTKLVSLSPTTDEPYAASRVRVPAGESKAMCSKVDSRNRLDSADLTVIYADQPNSVVVVPNGGVSTPSGSS